MKDTLCDRITNVISELIRGICFYKDQVVIEDRGEHDVYSLSVSPHMADYPLLCGKGGRQIKALRFIVREAVNNFGLRLPHPSEDVLVLDESYRGTVEGVKPFVKDNAFEDSDALKMIDSLIGILYEDAAHLAVETEHDGDKLRILITPASTRDCSVIMALSDVVYPWAFRRGKIVEVRIQRSGSTVKDKTINERLHRDRRRSA